MHRLFAAIGRVSVRLRWLMVVLWLAGTIVAVHFGPSISSQVKTDTSSFLPRSSPSIRAAALAEPFQAQFSLSSDLVAGGGGTPLTPAQQAAVDRAEAAVAKVPGVLHVRDQGVSADGQVRKALVEIASSKVGNDGGKGVVDAIRAAMNGAVGSAVPIHLTGQLASQVDIQSANSRTQRNTELFSILFIIILLLLVFRSVVAPLVTLIPAFLSLLVAQPVIALLAEHGAVDVGSITQLLLIVIVLGAGTDYGLFLIFRVREELAAGRSSHDAVTYSMARVGESITFSAATVIAALMSLLLAELGFYRGLGPALAVAIAIMLLAGLTLLPALLAIFGRAAFWPTRPKLDSDQRGAWGRIAARVVARPALTLGIGLALFGGLSAIVLTYTPAGFGGESSPSGSDSALGQKLVDRHFPAAVSNPTNVLFKLRRPAWQDAAQIQTAQRSLQSSGVFSALAGPLNPNGTQVPPSDLEQLYAKLGPPQSLPVTPPPGTPIPAELYQGYRSIGQFISPDGRTLQFYAALKAGAADSTQAMNATPHVRIAVTRAATTIGAVDSGLGGLAPASYDVSQTSSNDLKRIVPVVLIIIGILLAIMLRSLIAPIYLVLSVLLSYLASLGLAILAFVVIGGDPGLNFVLPFLMFVFLMALGEDYNILVMSRIREEAHDFPLTPAVVRAVQSTGGTVTSAGLILAGTFIVLTIASTGQVREIGLGLAAGVLLDTFFVRTLLIPSTVILLGRWNWWPSELHEVHAPGAPLSVEADRAG
ncbi:MAG: MMPL family transporter [Gaiellales bacterium]